jgi:hypothetical protein
MSYENQTQGNLREGKRYVIPHTADATLTASTTGSLHTNTGATGTVVATLPTATVGLQFAFAVTAAYALRIDPAGSELIMSASNGTPAAGKYIGSSAIGDTINLVCAKTGEWSVIGFAGTWTAEA